MPLVPTVMPQEEKKFPHSGTPGIVLPENADSIQAFKEISNVDAKSLNERLQAADAKKHQTPGIHIPDNADQIEALHHVSDIDPKTLNK